MPEEETGPIQPGESKRIAEDMGAFFQGQMETHEALKEKPPSREFPDKLENPFDWEQEKDAVLERFWEADDETPLELIVEPHVGAYNDLQCLEVLRQTRISPGEYRAERGIDFPFLLPDDPQADWTTFLQQVSTHVMLEELSDDPTIKREQDKRVENWNKKHPPSSSGRSSYGDINWGK